MDKRNYGIDLLRILSMFMVVILHVLGQGGLLDSAHGISFWSANFMEAASYCAVNCFAIISGYVMCRSKITASKIAELWLQLFFYTASISVIFFFVMPETIGFGSLLNAVFPVTRDTHWYITSYFGMYLLTPLLNAGIQNASKKQLEATLISCFVFICILPKLLFTSPYILNTGYSMLWLSFLYIFGGYMRQHNVLEKAKKRTGWIMYFLSVLITWLASFVIEIAHINSNNLLLEYTSPTIILAATGLFIALSKQSFPVGINKIIAFLSPAALGVYLIHTFNPVWENIIKGFATDYATQPTIIMLALVLLSAVIIYVACSAIDLLRIQLFRLCRVKALCIKIENLLNKIYEKFLTKIFN